MAVHSDILLGRIALERGWVTQEQLSSCLKEQASVSTREAAPLGEILLKQAHLTPSQVEDLLEEQKRRLSDVVDLEDAEMEDALLGQLLIKQGLVTERQIYECLRLQAERSGSQKESFSLGEILVEKKAKKEAAAAEPARWNGEGVEEEGERGKRWGRVGGGGDR